MDKMISRSKELEASSKITVGLLGAGFIGQMHALALRNAATSMWEPKIHVLPKILAEVDFELCTKVGERFDWEECTENWEEIVDDAEIDLAPEVNDIKEVVHEAFKAWLEKKGVSE